ncbi:MAG TPA: hypothetical protein VHM01_00780 [Alphaproteobacteria bacterium]|nr:hypothetical protein [Alphaproteobacteria bacterium]
MTGVMKTLAAGDHGVTIQATDREDEVGQTSKATKEITSQIAAV